MGDDRRRAPTVHGHAGRIRGGTVLGAAAVVALSASACSHDASAAPGSYRSIVVHAFDISSQPAGTTVRPGAVAVVDDQLTSTRRTHGSYPVIGYDAGTCVYTRVSPDGQPAGSPNDTTLAQCTATAVLPGGSVTASGVVRGGPGARRPATMAVSGGTGRYARTTGVVLVQFGPQFDTYTFELH